MEVFGNLGRFLMNGHKKRAGPVRNGTKNGTERNETVFKVAVCQPFLYFRANGYQTVPNRSITAPCTVRYRSFSKRNGYQTFILTVR